MVRRTTSKDRGTATKDDLLNMYEEMDEEDRKRLLDVARDLAGVDEEGTTKQLGTARKSLVPNRGNPSYLAAVDPNQYEHKAKKAQRNDHPDDMTP